MGYCLQYFVTAFPFAVFYLAIVVSIAAETRYLGHDLSIGHVQVVLGQAAMLLLRGGPTQTGDQLIQRVRLHLHLLLFLQVFFLFISSL